MKKVYFLAGVLLLMCACNTNSPSSDIYAPLTEKQMGKAVASIERNKECLIDWFGGAEQINFSIMSISAAQQSDVAEIALATYHCFGDTYVRKSSTADSEYSLTQRIYIVRTQNEPARTFYLDKKFNLIPTRGITDEDCGCDCWK